VAGIVVGIIRNYTPKYPEGPDWLMPSVPAPVANPMLVRLGAAVPVGTVSTGRRVKLNRNSFTVVELMVRVLLSVACWFFTCVTAANPGQLAPASALLVLVP
jgi:hypothetical protein